MHTKSGLGIPAISLCMPPYVIQAKSKYTWRDGAKLVPMSKAAMSTVEGWARVPLDCWGVDLGGG